MPFPQTQGLTQQEARLRVEQIRNVSYHLEFHFLPERDFFHGEAVVRFEGISPEKWTQALFLDATDLLIQRCTLNGLEIPVPPLENRRLTFPLEGFQGAKTSLYEMTFTYEGKFHANQVGLFRYLDCDYGDSYYFTHLEPYGANKVFPCFDQPDLLASFSVGIHCPKQWRGVTNTVFTLESCSLQDFPEEENNYWRSSPSLPFSTYLFALAVGPFQEFTHKLFPQIRLYVRSHRVDQPSHFFDKDFLFRTSAENLRYFEERFQSPYPYGKLDLVGVPDYINGGMENVGAIFLGESHMVATELPSRFQKYNQFILISHEISHLWFGDLVTMKWWDDLWLKESFATLMSYEAAVSISSFKEEVWTYFHEKAKRELFRLDAHSRVKPVSREVPDAETADWSFDGICYRKGASLLRQLQLYVGEEAFWKGVQLFFKTYPYQATTFQGLLACLEECALKPLSEYMEKWLKRPGYPKLWCHFQGEEVVLRQEDSLGKGRVWSLPLELQSALQEGTFLTQRVLLEKPEERFPLVPLVPSRLGSKTERRYLYPNGQDFSFTRPLLPQETLISIFKEPLPSSSTLRLMLQSALWDAVLSRELSFKSFIPLLQNSLKEERVALLYNAGIEKLLYGVRYFFEEAEQETLWNPLRRWATQELSERRVPIDSILSVAELLIYAVDQPEQGEDILAIEKKFKVILSRKHKYLLLVNALRKGWKSYDEILETPWFQKDPEFAREHTFYLNALHSTDKQDALNKVLTWQIPIERMGGYLGALLLSVSAELKKDILAKLLPALPEFASRMRYWSFSPIVHQSLSPQTHLEVLSLVKSFLKTEGLSTPLQDLLQGALEDLEENFGIRQAQHG